jgi:hypothetical protein
MLAALSLSASPCLDPMLAAVRSLSALPHATTAPPKYGPVGRSRVRDSGEKRICYNGCGRTDLKKKIYAGVINKLSVLPRR